eukprot:gene2870-4713_t
MNIIKNKRLNEKLFKRKYLKLKGIPNLIENKNEILKFGYFNEKEEGIKKEEKNLEMINSIFVKNKLKLVNSINEIEDLKKIKKEKISKIGFIGRSNVGKTSFLNSILKRKNCLKVSNKPGETNKIENWKIGNEFILVDFPGYGFAFKNEDIIFKWKKLLHLYLKQVNHDIIFILIDSRHGLKKKDFEILNFLEEFKIKFKIILTKSDLVSLNYLSKILFKIKLNLNNFDSFNSKEGDDSIFIISSHSNIGINYFQNYLIKNYLKEDERQNVVKNKILFL